MAKGGDHGVVGAGVGLSSGAVQRCRDAAKAASCSRVKGKGFEVGLGLLQARLAGGPLPWIGGDQWPH